MSTHNAPTGNSPPTKRITSAAPCNDMRPKLMALLTDSGVQVWDKYNKRPALISREEIEAFWAECKAWAEAGQDGERTEPLAEEQRV